MRAFETILRVSSHRRAARQTQGFLSPRGSRRVVIAVLAAGFILVMIWACALLYLLARLVAWAFV